MPIASCPHWAPLGTVWLHLYWYLCTLGRSPWAFLPQAKPSHFSEPFLVLHLNSWTVFVVLHWTVSTMSMSLLSGWQQSPGAWWVQGDIAGSWLACCPPRHPCPLESCFLVSLSSKAVLFIKGASNLKAFIYFNNCNFWKYFKSCRRIITPGPENEMDSEFLLCFYRFLTFLIDFIESFRFI